MMEMLSFPLNTKPLASCSVLFFIFAVLRLYVPIQPLLVLIFIIGTILLILKLYKKITMFIVIFTVTTLLMSTTMTSNRVIYNKFVMDSFNSCHGRVVGTISSFPDKTQENTSFYVKADKIYSNKGAECENVKVFVETQDLGFNFGDKIVFNGYLTRTHYNNAYSNYYISKGATLRTKEITVLKKESGNFIYQGLTMLRNKAIQASKHLMKEETRMLFRAIVAGDRTSFSAEFSDALTKSGTSHIASVSGLHVSIVGMGIYNLLKRRRKIALLLSFAAVMLFTVFTGAAPSTMRSAMMFTVYILSKVNVRQNDSFTSLALSAAVLSAINPYVVYDWGFILSFLSVLGIEVFYRDFSWWLRFLPKFLSDSVAITISAQLMTIPAITIMFGRVSSYVIISNIIVSIVFTYALYLSLLFVFIYNIPLIGKIFSVICTFMLDIICVTAITFSNMPYSYVGIRAFTVVEIICYYSVVVIFIFRKEISMWVFYVMIGVVVAALILSNVCISPLNGEYSLGDNSYVYVSKDFSKLVLCDDAKEVKRNLIACGKNFDVDYIVLKNPDRGDEQALFEIYKLVNAEKIYANEKDCNISFLKLAKSEGVVVKTYSEE